MNWRYARKICSSVGKGKKETFSRKGERSAITKNQIAMSAGKKEMAKKNFCKCKEGPRKKPAGRERTVSRSQRKKNLDGVTISSLHIWEAATSQGEKIAHLGSIKRDRDDVRGPREKGFGS